MINFDKTLFKPFDWLRVKLKRIFTQMGLRDMQTCGHCGRNQHIIWDVRKETWCSLPRKWHNETLCLECFFELCPEMALIGAIKRKGFTFY